MLASAQSGLGVAATTCWRRSGLAPESQLNSAVLLQLALAGASVGRRQVALRVRVVNMSISTTTSSRPSLRLGSNIAATAASLLSVRCCAGCTMVFPGNTSSTSPKFNPHLFLFLGIQIEKALRLLVNMTKTRKGVVADGTNNSIAQWSSESCRPRFQLMLPWPARRRAVLEVNSGSQRCPYYRAPGL